MRVNQVAKLLNVTPDTIRFYTRNRILQPSKSESTGYRNYSDKEVNRLRFVLSARQLGFSVADITQILAEADDEKAPCSTVRRLIEQRLYETEQRFSEMLELRKRMKQAVLEWSDKPDRAPSADMICHLIEGFSFSPK